MNDRKTTQMRWFNFKMYSHVHNGDKDTYYIDGKIVTKKQFEKELNPKPDKELI